MTIAQITEKMIDFYDGSIHDIDHFLKVWSYAKTIGELEGLDKETQFILEASAVLHDIACPLCRKKYGAAIGKYQEIEGNPMAAEFLTDSGLTEKEINRICFLVGHHHTPDEIDGSDYQILIEADYIVNACESGYSDENILNFSLRYFRTNAGKRILNSIFKNAGVKI